MIDPKLKSENAGEKPFLHSVKMPLTDKEMLIYTDELTALDTQEKEILATFEFQKAKPLLKMPDNIDDILPEPDDPCVVCEIRSCNEAHPHCEYQNRKPRRTIRADMTLIHGVPWDVQLKRQRWAANAQMRRDRNRGCAI